MSVVGPRPLLVQYLPLYNEHQARRHEVRPGFTGYAQVHGRNAIAEAICNVLVSVILVKKLGIYGVLIGTTCSYLIRDIMFIVYVNKNIFYRNLTSTVKNLTKMVTLFTMTVCCGIIISKFIGPDTWIKWGVVSATTFVIGVIFVSIYLLMFDREIFSLILNVIGVNKIMKGKNKKNLSHK